MSHNWQLGDCSNVGSEQNSSSEDELSTFSAVRKELEVMVIRTVHRVIEPVMEKLVRKIVKEEIELAQEKMLISVRRQSENEIRISEERSLQLQFLNKISLPVLTGKKIEAEECTSIGIALLDAITGKLVDSGPQASARVEIVVLEGDFEGDEGRNWTEEEFEKKTIREMEGKKSLLSHKVFLNLKGGIGSIDDISFTHNASWMKRCKFKLGARVVDHFDGIRVKEAVTEPFTVKDRRSILYEKRHPPFLSDVVWRLEKIGKDGALHKRLIEAKICTVKDFLILHHTNPQKLQHIFGAGTKMWKTTVDHARTCVIDKKVCFYSSSNFEQKTGVVFNEVGQLLGVLSKGHYVTVEKLSEAEKVDALKLVGSAFEHWEDVEHFDDEKSLTDACSCLFNASNPSSSERIENPNAHKPGTSQLIEENDCTQPSTSSQEAISATSSSQGANCSEDLHPTWNFLNQSPSYNTFNQDFNQFFHENDLSWLLNYNFDAQPENLGVVLHAGEESGGNDFQMVGAEAASVKKARMRWTMVASVPRWFAIRRIVGGIQIQKRQRLC